MGQKAFYASKAKQRQGIVACIALLALFVFFAVDTSVGAHPWLAVVWYAGIALSASMLVFFARYSRTDDPSLIVGESGIAYRLGPSAVVTMPWSNIARVAIEESSAVYRGGTFRSRFISVYPKDYGPVKTQFPLLMRLVAMLSMASGFAPIAIPEAMVGTPLEDVMAAISQWRTPNPAVQGTLRDKAAQRP